MSTGRQKTKTEGFGGIDDVSNLGCASDELLDDGVGVGVNMQKKDLAKYIHAKEFAFAAARNITSMEQALGDESTPEVREASKTIHRMIDYCEAVIENHEHRQAPGLGDEVLG
jgi:hypothetical protein